MTLRLKGGPPLPRKPTLASNPYTAIPTVPRTLRRARANTSTGRRALKSGLVVAKLRLRARLLASKTNSSNGREPTQPLFTIRASLELGPETHATSSPMSILSPFRRLPSPPSDHRDLDNDRPTSPLVRRSPLLQLWRQVGITRHLDPRSSLQLARVRQLANRDAIGARAQSSESAHGH